jgi:DNA-binding transcriptional LysR family regulator
MLPFDWDQHSLNKTPLDDETLLSSQVWAELRVFLALAKGKSFNRAAEMLNSSQPTVSRQVRRLQDVMGSQLFIPTQHGVMLTRRGEDLAHTLAKLDVALFSLTNDLQAESKQAEGVVRISVTEGLSAVFVAPSLQKFSAQYPNIQVHLKNPLNVKDFRANQTDMMIGACPLNASDIMCSKIGCLHFIPIVVEDYIHRHGRPQQGDLEQHFFVQSEYYCAKTGFWDAWNTIVARGRIAHFADNSIAYAMLVKAGLGIGLLGSYTAMETLTVPLDLELRISVPLYAIAFAERLKARPVRLAYEWLKETFSNNPWFGDEFRLDHPSGPHDAGFRKLFNIESQPETPEMPLNL